MEKYISAFIITFFIYGFAGWIWESCYVSLKKRKWINRGFLKGPLLPIYGSGAIVVLVSTIMVQNNTFLIFIIGMIAATVLEYITGELMESIFHVRYWDYSNKPFNINGHICLLSSLAWGIFSVLLVKIANPKIANLVVMIPNQVSEIIAYLATIFITVDAVQSFNEAINLKNVLVKTMVIMFSIFFLIILVNTILFNRTTQINYSVLTMIISTIIMYFIIYLLYKHNKFEYKFPKTYQVGLVMVAIFVIQIILANLTYADCGWDCGIVVRQAVNLLNGENFDTHYFAVFSNNIEIFHSYLYS